jgi:hypothetical protein
MYVRAYVFLRANEDAMVSASDCGCEEIMGRHTQAEAHEDIKNHL